MFYRPMIAILTGIVALALLLGGAPLAAGPTPAHAQTGVTWSAEYFDNIYLSGDPVVERRESGNQFYWGAGSPAPGVPEDQFSARFATDLNFDAGTYRFYILADDGVSLWIDFPPDKRPTLSTYHDPRPGELLTADVTLDAGMHHLQIDYIERTQDAYLYIAWESLADGAQGPNFPTPPTPVTWTTQWTAQYFNNPTLSGSPVLSQSEPDPNPHWGTDAPGPGVPADNFSARWIIYQDFAGGTYTVTTQADDGIRVRVDSQTVIDEWHGATPDEYTATFPLAAGAHSLVIEFYDAGAVAYLNFRMVKEPEGAPAQPPSPTGVTATVTAYRLNVRNAPVSGSVIAKIDRNETYPVMGRNSASTWWQLNVNGTIGWASGAYLNLSGPSSAVPVTDGVINPPTPTPSYGSGQCPGFMVSRLAANGYGRVAFTPGLPNNVRSQPDLSAVLIGQIPPGGIFYVISGPVCNNSTAWYQVNFNGLIGWTAEGQGSTYWLEPYTP